MLAMAYAASYPNRVDRMILIDSGGETTQFFQWFGDNLEARLHSEDREMQAYWASAKDRGVDADKAGQELGKALTPGYFFDRSKGLSYAASRPSGTFHADTQALLIADLEKNYDLRVGLRCVDAPVLIIAGQQDPLGDRTPEETHSLRRASTLEYIQKCGHFPWVEQPGSLDARWRSFWLEANSSCGPSTEHVTAMKSPRPTHPCDGGAEQSMAWPHQALCPYPKIARYSGTGSIEDASNFSCQ
jgi:pimeloyl-ACP methyl ester carboxylesterase